MSGGGGVGGPGLWSDNLSLPGSLDVILERKTQNRIGEIISEMINGVDNQQRSLALADVFAGWQ
eukprot:2488302-Amphidinium_carterae.1